MYVIVVILLHNYKPVKNLKVREVSRYIVVISSADDLDRVSYDSSQL